MLKPLRNLVLLLGLLACPRLVEAATRLNFPYLSFDREALTGIALVNPTAQDAAVTLTAFGADGQPLAGKDIRNPVEFTLRANEQTTRVVSDLFGPDIDPATVAWFQVSSTVDGVTGFFLAFNASNTFLDGAEPAPLSRRLVFNQVRVSDYTTEVRLANPGDKEATAQLDLRDNTGGSAGQKSVVHCLFYALLPHRHLRSGPFGAIAGFQHIQDES